MRRYNKVGKLKLNKNTFKTLVYYTPIFNPLAQFARRHIEITNLRNYKKRPKNTFLRQWGSAMGLKGRNVQKAFLAPATKSTYQISTLQLNLEGRYVKNVFFSRSSRGNLLISPLLIHVGGWFLGMLYNFWYFIN